MTGGRLAGARGAAITAAAVLAVLVGAALAVGSLTVTGAAVLGGSLQTTGVATATVGTAQNNYAPTNGLTSSVWRITPSANISITGLSAGVDGQILLFENADTTVGYSITFRHESASSTAANRLSLPDQIDSWALVAGGFALFQYDGTKARWLLLSWASTSTPKFSTAGASFTASGITFTNALTAAAITASGTLTHTGASFVHGSATTNYHVTDKDTSVRPTLSSCGTSPSVVGNDTSGVITAGSAVAGGCTLTFGTAWASNVGCRVSARDGTARAYSVSSTALTLTAVSSSGVYDYQCSDH